MSCHNAIYLVAALVVAWLVWYHCSKKRESYVNLSDLNNIGTVNDPTMNAKYSRLAGSAYNGAHFADLVGVARASPADTFQDNKPNTCMDRLNVLQGSQLLPRTSKAVTPYNIDVSDPMSYSYLVNTPRVYLKDRQRMQANPFLGDIDIKRYPNICTIDHSKYGVSSLNTSAVFNQHSRPSFRQLTNAGYRNMPMKVVNQETIMS